MRQSRLFATCSVHDSRQLALLVSERLGVPISPVNYSTQCSTELQVEIRVSVRNQDVYIIQAGVCKDGFSINDHMMRLLILIHACKHASARRIIVVLPYFPYGKFSKKDSPRGSITAKLVANMLQVAGVDHIITLDLHAPTVQSFFDIPVDNLLAEPTLAKSIKELSISVLQHQHSPRHSILYDVSSSHSSISGDTTPQDIPVISMFDAHQSISNIASIPQISTLHPASPPTLSMNNSLHNEVVIVARTPSGTKRITALADRLDVDFAIIHPGIHQHSQSYEGSDIFGGADDLQLVGNVSKKIVWIVDDVMDDPIGFFKAASLVRQHGATFVAVAVVHAILSLDQLSQIETSNEIDIIVVTNSNQIILPVDSLSCSTKFRIVDISPILSEAIRRIHHGESISSLFYKHL